MINDRGIIKYQGFLMPEHIKMLKELDTDDHKVPRPQLDERQIEDMEQLFSESLATQTILEIITWKNGFFSSKIGFVKRIDPISKKVFIKDELGTLISIDFINITNVSPKYNVSLKARVGLTLQQVFSTYSFKHTF
ncbi:MULTISPECIES: YolD-like family protein [Peribacillus]|uniref:YolD-like family protein n=1 Tax=Peribacillus TaxID=2675229 RepID=UPI001594EB0C|nr:MULTISPECIES: YolD-like family protein [Peribacillus]MBD8591643.1 YolD-like family protein [Peribacillus simplex]MCM3170369.1 YolD-like family protein [Peribacillus frigoritolerans]MEE3955801.1 YolD-like family protein [Peribacillus frigoritolerans]